MATQRFLVSHSFRCEIGLFASKGGDYSREAIISNIACWNPCPNKKILSSNKLNMGFLSVPNLVP